jgi:hypothetical protein
MNLVSMAMNFITPAIVSRIASALGIDSKIAQMAIGAALPSILAGVIGKSSKPEGLSQLSSMLGQQDSGLLSGLSNMIGGADQSKLVNSGSNMLGSLLGTSVLGGLAGAVSKFSGMGEAPTKSLLGMLAPVAMGTLAQQQKSNGLDAAGLAKMLMGQKENVANAMPAGFGDLLKGTGLLDGFPKPSVSGVVADAARTAASTAGNVKTAAQDAGNAVRHGVTPTATGLPSWLTWGALLGALLLGWYMFGPGSGRKIAAPPSRIVHNNVDVVPQVGSVYNTLRETMANIKDQNSATAALPRLQESARAIEGLQTISGQMTPANRGEFAKLIASYLPALRGLITTAMGTAGVSGVAKPVLDAILNRMEAMAKG